MGPDNANNRQGPSLPPRIFASTPSPRHTLTARLCLTLLCGVLALPLHAQQPRTTHFLAQRSTPTASSPALALQRARAQHLDLRQHQPRPLGVNLTAAWQPLGPNAILSPTYGYLTGRITAIAPDPNDISGNTLYLGTTGGGVWKSTNAAGPLASVTFNPLTDTLPVFSGNTSVIASLSIGAIAVQPSPNPVLLAGTGDPNDATDSYYGEGILRSTDAGLTWSLIQNSTDGANGHHSFLGLSTAAIAFSSATPSLVVAAFSTSPQSAIVAAANYTSIPGLYYSTDAGQTWQMATVSDGASIVQTPQPLGTGQVGNAATSVLWNPIRKQFIAAIRSHGYYTSSDGINWSRLPAQPGTNLTTANCPIGVNGAGSATCPIFRGTLAVQPTTGDTYALTIDSNNLDQGLWQDLCYATANTCATPSPTFATRIDNAALEVGNSAVGSGSTAISQGAYNLTLAATPAPNNTTLLFAGTLDLYRCSIASNASTCNFRNTTNALDGCNAPAKVAPSQHAIAFSTSTLLFLGNDGGLWRSPDTVAETGSVCSSTDAGHFDNLNAGFTGSLAEITGFAQHPTDPNTLLVGLGAQGSAATSNLITWPQLSGGEGGFPQLDPNSPNIWLLAIGTGINLAQCTLGSACTAANFTPPATIGAPQVSNDAALLDAPTLLDPSLTSNLILGTCRVWRGPASSGSTWSPSNAISPAFDNSSTPCSTSSPLIRSLAAGGPSATSTSSQLSGSQVIYAGIAGSLDGGGNIPGHLFRSTATGSVSTATAWVDTAIPNTGLFDISSIAVDTHDATGATVYATIMGFGVPHLFRSTNFGTTWTNVSANLPDAPANAILIDPNDANTLYIALDTGVYVTQSITTCTTANCWSGLGTALPNAPIIALSAAPQLLTGDGRRGMIRAATYGRGLWQTPLLTAVSLAQPAITLSTNTLTFAAQQVATQSTAQTITVTSTGNSPVTFTTPALTGDFALTANTCISTLAVNATCTFQITFAPTATGPRTGQLTIYANISGGQAIVTLSGNGTAAASIVLTPLTLTFPATIVNQTSTSQIITVANTGGNPATLQTSVLTGDFSFTANTCTTTLPASTACAVAVAFTPTASGARTGTLSFTDSAGTQTAQLSGTGQANASDTLTPTSLTFAQQQITTTSPPQLITLANVGDVALTLITTTISPGDFSIVNSCGNSLAPHSICALSITFAPTATGTRTAIATLSDQFRSQTIPLTGTGVAPPGVSLSPTSLTFAALGVGLTSQPQTLTLTNNGGLPLIVTGIAATPGFTVINNSCLTTLAVNSACTLAIVFTPTAAGSITGSLTLTDNAPSTTQTATLSGTGIDFTFIPNGPTTATLSSGTSAVYPLLLSSIAGLSNPVAFICTGAPTNSICTVTPTMPTLGGTTAITATVQTGVQAHLVPPPSFGSKTPLILLAILLPLTLLRRKRSKAAINLALLTALGCGQGRYNPPATGPPVPTYPTPNGTYNLTVTATAAGIAHTVGLTLIVQ